MNPIKELTRAEEEIMQEIWALGGGFVKDIIDRLPIPKPAYNTVSTIVRILETKGFLMHESFGKSHKYLPVTSKEDYKKLMTNKLVDNYYKCSAKELISFFVQEEQLDLNELDELLTFIRSQKS